EHPSASALLASGEKLNSDAALAATETTLGVLRRAGFDPERSAAIARSGLWTALMLVMSEPGFGPGMTEADRAERQRSSRVRLALLPADRYPHLVEAAVPLTVCDDPDLHYQFGVDLFIAGVQAVAGGAGGRRHPAGPAEGRRRAMSAGGFPRLSMQAYFLPAWRALGSRTAPRGDGRDGPGRTGARPAR